MLKMQRASHRVPPMVLISMPMNQGSFIMLVCSGPETILCHITRNAVKEGGVEVGVEESEKKTVSGCAERMRSPMVTLK